MYRLPHTQSTQLYTHLKWHNYTSIQFYLQTKITYSFAVILRLFYTTLEFSTDTINIHMLLTIIPHTKGGMREKHSLIHIGLHSAAQQLQERNYIY